MKKKFVYIVFMLTCFSLLEVACSKGGDDGSETPDPPIVNPDGPEEPTIPTFDTPNWEVKDIGAFEHTMVVAVALPDSLLGNESETDRLALFSNQECRGVAERVEVDPGEHVWMAMVYGGEESEDLTVRYYSSVTRYMYESSKSVTFATDCNYGTIDEPKVLELEIVMEK